ncbi:hypothetical protein [Streptomyces sp. NPDC047071]|uniref:hypothetical protein n=1 Tax=Streptomyces sp. NPDC047071 TaxID=3154808 RepID=UPI0034552D25
MCEHPHAMGEHPHDAPTTAPAAHQPGDLHTHCQADPTPTPGPTCASATGLTGELPPGRPANHH